MRNRLLLTAAIMLFVVFADQASKSVIRANLLLGEAIPSEDSFFRITYTLNDGIAFSMFEGYRMPLIAMQSLLIAVILVLMYVFCRRHYGLLLAFSFPLMLGGGIGNLIDRIRIGAVTDFVAVGSFPIFNLADSALTLGCALTLIYVIHYDKKNRTGTAGTAR
jgi:signal peptidase II